AAIPSFLQFRHRVLYDILRNDWSAQSRFKELSARQCYRIIEQLPNKPSLNLPFLRSRIRKMLNNSPPNIRKTRIRRVNPSNSQVEVIAGPMTARLVADLFGTLNPPPPETIPGNDIITGISNSQVEVIAGPMTTGLVQTLNPPPP
ncbi:13701_t:CDS:2, partial [Acaulospora colombiana]